MFFTVRKATLDDLEPLSHLFDGYRVFYEKESDLLAGKAFLKELMEQKQSEIFVAEDQANGTLTGFVQLYPIFSSTRMKRLWLLNDLFVNPVYRGRGISKALLQRAQALCGETKACGLILETAKTNVIGNHLYPATGFVLDQDHHYYSWDFSS